MAKLDDLKVEADGLGLKYAPNIGEAGLTKKLEAFKKDNPNNSEVTIVDEDGNYVSEVMTSEEADALEQDSEDDKPEEKPAKKALKPLNASATPEVKVEGPKWSGGSKNCLGSNASYPDDEEHFPLYKTAKGDKNCYSKDFLDKKVESGFIKVKKGVYVAVDPSKKK